MGRFEAFSIGYNSPIEGARGVEPLEVRPAHLPALIRPMTGCRARAFLGQSDQLRA